MTSGFKIFICGSGVAAIALLALSLNLPAVAAPLAQYTLFPTPTPGPDGRIIYIVQPNDTLWRISAITGVTLDQLRELNDLTSDVVVEGQPLLLGLAGPAGVTASPGPTTTPEPLVPTPSPGPGTGMMCVLLYNDQNGNSQREESEPSIAGGAINASNRSGGVSLTADTAAGLEPHCFEDVPEGEYTVSVALPDGYNPTTERNFAMQLGAGDILYLNFGAQANFETLSEAPTPQGSGKNALLGVAGGLLLLFGAGLGVYAGLLRKGSGR